MCVCVCARARDSPVLVQYGRTPTILCVYTRNTDLYGRTPTIRFVYMSYVRNRVQVFRGGSLGAQTRAAGAQRGKGRGADAQ